MSYHRCDAQTPENGKAIRRLSEIETVAELIEDYFHFSLLANDKTFSDIYGDAMAKQEANAIATRLVDNKKKIITFCEN